MKSQYPEAMKAVREWVARQKLGPGSGLPSVRRLSGQLGFTPKTMELACNFLISGGLLRRDGYKLSVGAETPAHAPISGEIHVLSYLESFSRAAGRILAERGVKHRTAELSPTKHASPVPVLRKVLAEKPAGVILWMPSWMEGLVPLLEKETTPVVVCADAAPPGLSHSTAGTDLLRGTETALRHLFGLGHRQIALVSCDRSSSLARELAACFQKVCKQLGISSAAIWQMEIGSEDEWCEMLLERSKRPPRVTAIFGRGFFDTLAATTFDVPRELSIVRLYDFAPGSLPPLTAVALRDGESCIAVWACSEIISRIQSVESGHPMPPPHHALFVPELIDRGSTRALARRTAGFPACDRATSQAGKPVAHLAAPAPASPGDSWNKTYAYLKKSRYHDWRQLDLSKLANHSMTREHGWLGTEPLLHFPAGLRPIHGVPFQVIDETRNGGRAVVTFRSPHTHTAEGKELPARVVLPVGGPVKALYFLHGCGYARPSAFAEYRIHFKKGKAASIPLIPIGSSPQFTLKNPGSLKPNLQDWWTGFRQQDFPHAKYVTVFNPAEPGEYERYLYTLEWINPRPGEEVSHLEARVDPDAGPTLALIAVTALV